VIFKIKQMINRFHARWTKYSPEKRRYLKIGFTILLVVLWIARRNFSSGINLDPAEIHFLPTYADHVQCVTRPKALAQTYLSVQYGGRLDRINFAPGERVKTGDIIAIVDQTANSAGLKSALSAFRLAQSDHARSTSLFASGAVTREELDSTRSRLDVKRAELEQAKQRVEDSVVRSPMDGIISVVVFKVGDKVPDGGRIAAVEDPNGVLALCRFSTDIAATFEKPAKPEVAVGASAELAATTATTPAESNTETAASTIIPVVKPDDHASTWKLVETTPPVTMDVPVRITVEKSTGGFQGLDVDVRVETSKPEAKAAIGKLTEIQLRLPEKQNVVKLPSLAVVRRSGKPYVLLAEGRWKYRWNEVSIVKQTPQETIATGVAEGSKVLLLKDDLSKIETYVNKRLAD
jgi:multidrug efflux pump subunit AcrA (membrane-fusion protein)